MSFIGILTAASCTTVLQGSNVGNAAMNICWPLGWSEAEVTLQRDKRRHFCSSCHQRRVVEFGEWLCEEVLKAVPHRHFVFSIPKILRRYFLYDRKLLSDLSRCGWESLKEFFKETVPENGAVPGAVIAIQTFGDFLGFNPHLHVLCFPRCAGLLSKGKITEDLVDMLMNPAWGSDFLGLFD